MENINSLTSFFVQAASLPLRCKHERCAQLRSLDTARTLASHHRWWRLSWCLCSVLRRYSFRNAHQRGWGCIRRSRRLCKTSLVMVAPRNGFSLSSKPPVNGVSPGDTYLLRVGYLPKFFFVREPQWRRAFGPSAARCMWIPNADDNAFQRQHHKLDSGRSTARWA